MGFLNGLLGGGGPGSAGSGMPKQVSYGDGADLSTLPGVSPDVSQNSWGATTQKEPSPLRNLLGAIGDAFLVQSGNKAEWGPRQDERKQADAFQGFFDDPEAALKRISQTPGGLGTAETLYKDLLTQRHNGTEDSLNRAKTINEKMKAYGPLAAFAMSAKDDPNAAQRIYPIIQKKATEAGLTEGVDYPTYDAKDPVSWAHQMAGMGINAYQQARSEQFGQGLGIQQENADTNRAYRQGQTSQGAQRVDQGQQRIDQTSPNDVLGGIYKKVASGQKLTQPEINLYNDNLKGKGSTYKQQNVDVQRARESRIYLEKDGAPRSHSSPGMVKHNPITNSTWDADGKGGWTKRD